MKLYICEKPSQGKDLARNLGITGGGSGFIGNKQEAVTWAVGHLVMQANPDDYDAKYKNWKDSYDNLPFVPNNWNMLPNPKTKKQLSVVRGLIKLATEVVIATDGDREGEVIGRELLDFYNYQGKINRLWLTALDDSSIQKALTKIQNGSETENLYYAGLGRSRADWIVGLNLTRVVSIKAQTQGHQGVLSVGRVQTPTLKIIVDRDLEIENFKPKDYFDIKAIFSGIETKWQGYKNNSEKDKFDAENRCINLDYANSVVAKVKGSGIGIVEKFETTRKKVSPPLLYSLSKLQQECSKKFGFGAAEVLKIAQSLYETHKATTYPRSDCQYLPIDQLSEAKEILNSLTNIDRDFKFNADLDITSKVWNNKKVTAHHGIIPTNNSSVNIDNMSSDELKVYDLIRRSYVAQFYPNYEYDKTDIIVSSSGETFTNNINIDVALGWKEIVNSGSKLKTNEVPNIATGQELNIDNVLLESKKTTPQNRYTEGSLISAMEKAHQFITDERLKKVLKGNEGIGTEATRANIIETLKQRGFVKTSKKQIVSTDIGRELIDILPPQLADPGTTAILESLLDKIATGELLLDKFMEQQTAWLNKMVENIKQNPLNIKSDIKSCKCPNCGKDMFLRQGKKGKFFACSGYPECKTTAMSKNGKPIFESDMPDCPKCDKKLQRIKGKKGYFWSCKGYFDTPKCEFTAKDNKGKPVFDNKKD
jgi:DNA topoisomerase-3